MRRKFVIGKEEDVTRGSLSALLSAASCMALSATLAAAARSATLVVDDFSTVQSLSLQYYRGSYSITGPAPEALGGERDLVVRRVGGTSNAGFGSSVYGEKGLQFLSSAKVVGAASVVWDGPDGDPLSLDADGLGGLDWLGDGYRAISLAVAVADHPAQVIITAYAASDPSGRRFVTHEFEIPASTRHLTIDVPLLDFSSASYTPFEVFSGLGALQIDIIDQDHGALDLMIDSVTLSIVPEPAAAQLAACVIGGGLLAVWRRRGGFRG